MRYVEGFVVPVRKNKLAAYKRASKKFGKICREHGALDYREYVADDVKPGKTTSFPQAVKLKPNEVVVFGWVAYKSRAQRDRVNAKLMIPACNTTHPKNPPSIPNASSAAASSCYSRSNSSPAERSAAGEGDHEVVEGTATYPTVPVIPGCASAPIR